MDHAKFQGTLQKMLKDGLGGEASGGLSTPASLSDEMGGGDSDNSEEAILAKQQAALKTYFDSVPYRCESVEEMEKHLANVIQKIYIAAKCGRDDIIRHWDEMLCVFVSGPRD